MKDHDRPAQAQQEKIRILQGALEPTPVVKARSETSIVEGALLILTFSTFGIGYVETSFLRVHRQSIARLGAPIVAFSQGHFVAGGATQNTQVADTLLQRDETMVYEVPSCTAEPSQDAQPREWPYASPKSVASPVAPTEMDGKPSPEVPKDLEVPPAERKVSTSPGQGGAEQKPGGPEVKDATYFRILGMERL